MNRIDRLTSMILMLQSHRVVTAETISAHFEISVRTVYRDIAALSEAGVPIAAEPGVGYSLMRGYNLPPIMFTETEAAALFMSGEITNQFGDESLNKNLSSALLKVRSALPEGHQSYLTKLGTSMEVWNRPNGFQAERSLMPVQEAVVRRRCILLRYDAGAKGSISERTVDPLGLIFYGRQWHLIAWCRLREAIRDFRLDRVQTWEVLEETFTGHENFSIRDFYEHEVDAKALVPVTIDCETWALERVLHDAPFRIESKEALDDGRYLIHGLAYSLEWLAHWLVGIGTGAVVRNPQDLRELAVEEASKIIAHYSKPYNG